MPVHQKKRKFEMGRQPAMTKLAQPELDQSDAVEATSNGGPSESTTEPSPGDPRASQERPECLRSSTTLQTTSLCVPTPSSRTALLKLMPTPSDCGILSTTTSS